MNRPLKSAGDPDTCDPHQRALEPRLGSADKASREYGLAPHIYACRLSGGCVLLDLQRNRYLGLDEAQTRILSMHVDDDSVRDDMCGTTVPLPQAWVNSGLLQSPPSHLRMFAPDSIDLRAALQSIEEHDTIPEALRLAHLLRFCWHCARVRRALRTTSLFSIADDLYAAKHGRATIDAAAQTERLGALVGAFRRMRRHAFAAHDQCLFHALTLVRFLGDHQLFPTWVIGVRLHPWGAHSWVQHGQWLLDATPESVREYTPILAV